MSPQIRTIKEIYIPVDDFTSRMYRSVRYKVLYNLGSTLVCSDRIGRTFSVKMSDRNKKWFEELDDCDDKCISLNPRF